MSKEKKSYAFANIQKQPLYWETNYYDFTITIHFISYKSQKHHMQKVIFSICHDI